MTANRLQAFLKWSAITIYTDLIALAMYISSVFLFNLQEITGGWTWTIKNISMTFIPWLFFLLATVRAQLRSQRLLPLCAVQTMLVGGMLLYALVSHGYPAESRIMHAAHILLAVSFGVWNLRKSRGSGNT